MFTFFRRESLNLFRAFMRPTFIYLTIIGNTVMLVAVTLFYHFENAINPNIHSYLDCLWWGVATITSVGYGDIVPITAAGKWVGIFLMYTGTILFVLFTGFLVTVWTSSSMEREMQPLEKEVKTEEHLIKEIYKRLERIESHIRGKNP